MKVEVTVEQLLGELEQALNKIEFLHGCLTDPTYKYAYPEMTLVHIERLQKIVGQGTTAFTATLTPTVPAVKRASRNVPSGIRWMRNSNQPLHSPSVPNAVAFATMGGAAFTGSILAVFPTDEVYY